MSKTKLVYRADPKKSPRFNSQNIVKELLKYVKENLCLVQGYSVLRILPNLSEKSGIGVPSYSGSAGTENPKFQRTK